MKEQSYEPGKGPNKRTGNGYDKQQKFSLIPFDQITFDTRPAYLVKGVVPRTGLCVFWGPPKCGKSFLVFDLMMHIALGWFWHERRVQQGPVVYCAMEGQTGLKNRTEAFRQRKLTDYHGEVPFYLVADVLNLVADHAALIASIRAALGDIQPVAITLDTLNRSLAGSENDDKDMAAYVRAADALREAFGCVVILVHHCGHEGTRPRGHSSLMGALDAQTAVKRDAADNIVATVELMKDGPQGHTFTSRLEVVELGTDDDGDKIDSCVIEPVGGATASTKRQAVAKLTKGGKIALNALQDALGDCGAIPPASNHIPPGVKAITISQWRDYAIRRGISTSADGRAKNMAFQRATECLVAAKAVAIWEPHAWPV